MASIAQARETHKQSLEEAEAEGRAEDGKAELLLWLAGLHKSCEEERDLGDASPESGRGVEDDEEEYQEDERLHQRLAHGLDILRVFRRRAS